MTSGPIVFSTIVVEKAQDLVFIDVEMSSTGTKSKCSKDSGMKQGPEKGGEQGSHKYKGKDFFDKFAQQARTLQSARKNG